MKCITPILLFFFSGFCCAQNLVPNPSFEEYYDCSMPGYFNNVKYWVNPTGYSPDYLNPCDPAINGFGVPQNGYGYQNARTGVAYVGLISMIETDGREYIQTELTEALTAGKQYSVAFYVSLADHSLYSSNDIGAYFSNTPVSVSHSWVLPYTPQISNNPVTNPLTDTLGWTEVSGIFMALGGEKYMTIGNFKEDLFTDTMHFNWGANRSYHYIDDVSVICLDCAVGISETTIDSRISIFPNPASDYLTIDMKTQSINSFQVYDITGRLIKTNNTNFSYTHTLDISDFSKGIYLLRINSNSSIINYKFYKQ